MFFCLRMEIILTRTAHLGTLLADAVPVADAPLGDTGLRAHVFRTGEQIGAVTWATSVPTYDHHWRPAQRGIHGIALECPKGSVRLLDIYWNEQAAPRWEDGRLLLDLNEEPTFLMDRTLGEAKFLAMLRGAKAPPRPVKVALAFVGAAPGKVGYACR